MGERERERKPPACLKLVVLNLSNSASEIWLWAGAGRPSRVWGQGGNIPRPPRSVSSYNTMRETSPPKLSVTSEYLAIDVSLRTKSSPSVSVSVHSAHCWSCKRKIKPQIQQQLSCCKKDSLGAKVDKNWNTPILSRRVGSSSIAYRANGGRTDTKKDRKNKL